MTDRNPHYRVAEGSDAWALETAVKTLMDDGWLPQGGVCVVPTGMPDGGSRFYQAMTRNAVPILPVTAIADVIPFPDPVDGADGL